MHSKCLPLFHKQTVLFLSKLPFCCKMSRSYQDFEPDCHYKEGEAQDILEFDVKRNN